MTFSKSSHAGFEKIVEVIVWRLIDIRVTRFITHYNGIQGENNETKRYQCS